MERKRGRGVYTNSHGPGPFFGRLLISLIFILAGLQKIINFDQSVTSLKQLNIQGAQTFIIIALLLELIGGVMLLIGWRTRIAIFILMIFLLPATLIFHAFWNYHGNEMATQLSNFLKNLTIYGGLFLLLSYGPGSWSIDALPKK